MFEFVHSAPETRTTPARMALTADRAGYDALVLRNHTDADEYPSFEVPEDPPVSVHEGVEVRAETAEQTHKRVRRANKQAVVTAHGGEEEINRAAIEAGVDLLAHPNGNGGHDKDRPFDHVCAREAAQNGVAVEVSLAPVLRSTGGERVGSLRDLRATLKLIRKYGTPFVITADPYTHLQVRCPRELRALTRLLGIGDGEFERATEETPRGMISEDDSPIEVVE